MSKRVSLLFGDVFEQKEAKQKGILNLNYDFCESGRCSCLETARRDVAYSARLQFCFLTRRFL